MIVVDSQKIRNEIIVPSSKSYSNRLLILASSSLDQVEITNLSQSSDVITLKSCLEKVGVIFEGDRVLNSFPACEKDGALELETGDGGTTNRFLLAMLAKGKNKYRLRPAHGFMKRPLDQYLSLLISLGACVNKGDDFIEIQGPITIPLDFVIGEMESSQFISALKIAFWESEIRYKNVEKSRKYLQLTDHLILKFRQNVRKYQVPTDFSSISYPLILAAARGEKIRISNCFEKDDLQADSRIIEIMKGMGANLEFTEKGLQMDQVSRLKPFEVDGNECPDLIPGLAFLASCCEGKSLLRNLKILRGKESDRLFEIKRLLVLYQVRFEEVGDDLIIWGPTIKSEYKKFESPNDHRMIMTAYLFMKKHSGGEIENHIHINKSFPGFFDLMG